jgi:hypothetical protein
MYLRTAQRGTSHLRAILLAMALPSAFLEDDDLFLDGGRREHRDGGGAGHEREQAPRERANAIIVAAEVKQQQADRRPS